MEGGEGEAECLGDQQTFEGLVLGQLGHHSRGDSYKRLLRYSGFFQGKGLGREKRGDCSETASETSLQSLSSRTSLSAAETAGQRADEKRCWHASLATAHASPPSAGGALQDPQDDAPTQDLNQLQMEDSDHSSACEEAESPLACCSPAPSAQDIGPGACLALDLNWPYVVLDASRAAKKIFGLEDVGKSFRVLVLLGPKSDSVALRRLVDHCKAAENESWSLRSSLTLYTIYGEELNLLGSCAPNFIGGKRCAFLSLISQEVGWGHCEEHAEDETAVGTCVVSPMAPFEIHNPNLDLLSLVGWMEKDLSGRPLSFLCGESDPLEWAEMIEAAAGGGTQEKKLQVCNAFGQVLECFIAAEPFNKSVKLFFRAVLQSARPRS